MSSEPRELSRDGEVPTLPLARVRCRSFFVFFKYLTRPTLTSSSCLTRTRAALSAVEHANADPFGCVEEIPLGGTP